MSKYYNYFFKDCDVPLHGEKLSTLLPFLTHSLVLYVTTAIWESIVCEHTILSHTAVLVERDQVTLLSPSRPDGMSFAIKRFVWFAYWSSNTCLGQFHLSVAAFRVTQLIFVMERSFVSVTRSVSFTPRILHSIPKLWGRTSTALSKTMFVHHMWGWEVCTRQRDFS